MKMISGRTYVFKCYDILDLTIWLSLDGGTTWTIPIVQRHVTDPEDPNNWIDVDGRQRILVQYSWMITDTPSNDCKVKFINNDTGRELIGQQFSIITLQSATSSRKESKLYIRSKENNAGVEDSFDFFETNSCVMTRPKTNWLAENNLGKNGRGEYGVRIELQACFSEFTIKCQRLSEILYFISYFMGDTTCVTTIDANNKIFSHKLHPFGIEGREMPTFTALYTDGGETHVMTHCIITDFSLIMNSGGNGVAEATFNGICNLHYDNSGDITKTQINTPWTSGAYTEVVQNEPILNFKKCSFYIGDALETIPSAIGIDYSNNNISEISDISMYINSITVTGSNGITGADLLRAGGYGVLNNQQRKDFKFSCELNIRKNTLVKFNELAVNNEQKAFEIQYQGKTIKDALKYGFIILMPIIQVEDISEDDGAPVNQTVSFIVHSEELPIVIYSQNKFGLRYNTCLSVDASSSESASGSSSSGGLSSSSSSQLDD